MTPVQTQVRVFQPEVIETKSRFLKFPAKASVKRPRIALVLSGGGSRSIAAIGVLRVLEQYNIPIDLIIGTSMGSIVGGLYAIGYSTDQLKQIADSSNWEDLLSYTDEARRQDMFLDQKIARERSILVLRFEEFEPVIPSAFSSGQRLSNYLNLLVINGIYQSQGSFDELKIPFRAVTTDLVSGKRIVLDRGELTEALRASMAVPLLFSSVTKDTLQLLDGGLVDNLPVDVAIDYHADIIIAVDMISPLRPRSKLNALWEVADQITGIMMQEAIKVARSKADVVITPNMGDQLSSDFSDLDSLIASGMIATQKAIPQIRTLITERITRNNPQQSMIRYSKPRFYDEIGVSKALQDSLKLFERSEFIAEQDLQNIVNWLYETGDYQSVSIRANSRVDATDITISGNMNPILDSVNITGNEMFSTDTLRLLFTPLIGNAINEKRVVIAIEHLLTKYRIAGYSLARVQNVEFDTTAHTLQIHIDEGMVYRMDIRGTTKARDWILRRELPWKNGDLLTQSKVAQGIANLNSTGLFEQTRLSVHHEGDSSQHTITTIHAKERATELIRFGLRTDNERNIQPSVDIRNDNVLGAGVEFGFFIGGGTRNQSYIAEVKAIRIFNSYLTFNLKGFSLIRDINYYADVSSNNTYNIDRNRVGEYREVRNGGMASFGTQLERLGSVTIEGRLEKHKVYNIFNNPITNQEYNVSSIRFGTSVDTQDKFPYPTDGIVFNFYYESALVKVIDAIGFTKMYFSYQKHQRILRTHTVSTRFAIGVADETLPISEQFSLGGQQNFFGYREDNVRGRQLLAASVEYQYKLPFSIFFDTYLKARYDFGSLWERAEEMRIEDFKHGIGVTLGLDTPIGPTEFAIGRSFYIRKELLERPVSFGSFTLYFSIGYPLPGVVRY